MTLTPLEHPISPHLMYRGNDFDSAKRIAGAFQADVFPSSWTRCSIGLTAGEGTPRIVIDDGAESFTLGEIGLAYILYRFRDIVDPRDGRLFYRNGRYGELSTLLSIALDKLDKIYDSKYERYYFTHHDNELMGVLTSYSLIHHSYILSQITDAELDKRVTRWIWKPTEMRIGIRGGIVKRMFHYGVQILNGETGHRALAFRSALWSASLNGMTYEFSNPIKEYGYARHMPTKSLIATVDKLGDSLSENKLAEVFEQMAGLPGTWVTRRFPVNLDLIKARDTTKEKLGIAFDDDVEIFEPETALDMAHQLMETASRINISAARAAQAVINHFIGDIMKSEQLPTGEVIPDAIPD